MEDAFLNGRVVAVQSQDGPRAGLDAVMLAAAVSAKPGDTVVEFGVGAGVVSLCLMARVSGLAASGLEFVGEMAALAEQNAARNNRQIAVHVGDVKNPPPAFLTLRADHVFANPPFIDEGKGTAPAENLRKLAHMNEGALGAWFDLAGLLLKTGGSFTLVHRADALPLILELFSAPAWGDVQVLPLWPRADVPARRVLVRGRKAKLTPFKLLPGLVLHESDGRYTSAADAILRDGAGISWS